MKTTAIAFVLLILGTEVSAATFTGEFITDIWPVGHDRIEVVGGVTITTDGADFNIDHFGVDGEYVIAGDATHPQWTLLPFIVHLSYSSSSLLFPPTIAGGGDTGEVTLDLETEYGGQRVIGNFVEVLPVTGSSNDLFHETLSNLHFDLTDYPSSIDVTLPLPGKGVIASTYTVDNVDSHMVFQFFAQTITLQAVPEPSSLWLAIGLVQFRRRRITCDT